MFVTGVGAVTPAGFGPEPLWRSACDGTPSLQDGVGRVDDAALIRSLATETELPFLPVLGTLSEGLPRSRFALFALHAISQAMRDAGWTELRPDDGLVLGTTTGNILFWEPDIVASARAAVSDEALTDAIRHEPLGLCVESLAAQIGLTGRLRLVTSACASSTQAIGLAALWLRSGAVKRCLAGGAEVLCRLTLEGFRSLQLLSPRTAAPFDEKRSGINLSEGAGIVCLETGASSRARAAVSGFGFSSDAHHMTAPHPEGAGCLAAMRAALELAGLEPRAITWVHAHGTGSPANDVSEAAAIARLFGAGDDAPWVSSTKAVHGHALAASGAIETVLALMAMRHGKIPRTTGLHLPDPKIRLRHPPHPLDMPVKHVLKNSLGFGGANASLVLSQPDAVGAPLQAEGGSA